MLSNQECRDIERAEADLATRKPAPVKTLLQSLAEVEAEKASLYRSIAASYREEFKIEALGGGKGIKLVGYNAGDGAPSIEVPAKIGPWLRDQLMRIFPPEGA